MWCLQGSATCLILLLSAHELSANDSGFINIHEAPFALRSSSVTSDELADKACNLNNADKPFVTRHFAFEGRCKQLNQEQDCAYYDYRKLDLSSMSGFDQQGVYAYQVTFPGDEHLWAALSIDNAPDSVFCWSGGAIVGRNPLAMTWSGDTGTKQRKNNFILSKSGDVHVHGARIHNLHDIFLPSSRKSGIHVQGSWITWNRDDVFEGYLHNIGISDTLIDGTFTFISDPDGECDDKKKAGHKNIAIENSLIRLQRQPGPYARHTTKWHWKIEGGHNTLWKLDSCGWDNWPKFVLRNNVFLIEGPRTTRKTLNYIDCRLALPGDCEDLSLSNIEECSNNLFLYTDYKRWRVKNTAPGPVPQPGNRFYNADNPTYLPNGIDCYQRLTDDKRSAGYADVLAVWQRLRLRWISRHTDVESSNPAVMQIPGVDFPVFEHGSKIRVSNRKTAECLTSGAGSRIFLRRCDDSAEQVFEIETFDDGKLVAAILLKDWRGYYLRSQPPQILEKEDGDLLYDPVVFSEVTESEKPSFDERWYVLPLNELINTTDYFSIESDAIGRSFFRQTDSDAEIQPLYANGINTALPQPRFAGGDDHSLHWILQSVD